MADTDLKLDEFGPSGALAAEGLHAEALPSPINTADEASHG